MTTQVSDLPSGVASEWPTAAYVATDRVLCRHCARDHMRQGDARIAVERIPRGDETTSCEDCGEILNPHRYAWECGQ